MLYKIIIAILFSFLIISCDEVTDNQINNEFPSGEWLIPENEIFDGGPGKDGIPAITNPDLIPVSSVTFLNDNDLVIAVKINDEVRVYPHAILDWHEIINDGISDIKFAVTYCPLTGSAIAYNRVIEGLETTFGVSGLLYNTNLIPYDRTTNSNWSQMKMQSVNGSLIGKSVETLPILETKWETVKDNYPKAKLVSTNTGYSRSYGVYPYGDYKNNNNLLLFPVSNNDTRLEKKERVLGILINETPKAFRFEVSTDSLILKENSIAGVEFVVLSSLKDNLIVAFQNKLEDGKTVNLKVTSDSFPIVLEDQFNNKYDLFGYVVDGGDKGKKLEAVTQYIAYWFAWSAFYPETSIE